MPPPLLGGARGIIYSCRPSVCDVVSTISVVCIDGFLPNVCLL